MRIMLTGANGQLGWELARSLLPLGKVLTPARTEMDLLNPQSLCTFLDKIKPDVIVNAAAWTDVERAEEEEAAATLINATAVEVLAGAAKHHNAFLIHYSTDYVFDGSKTSPYIEADKPAPMNAYGRSKLAGEEAIQHSGCDHIILRTSWVYAARRKNFLLTMLHLMQDRENLKVISDQIGAPTWARTIADTTAHVIRQSMQERSKGKFHPGLFHLANSGETSWYGFACKIADIAKQSPAWQLKVRDIDPILSAEYQSKAKRPGNSRLDTTRLQQHFNVILPPWDSALELCMLELNEHL